ncbi:MAG: hypothetical protein ACOX5T_07440 [Candidatus Cryptobacteroides sp.]|jgi:hypothetical protein
MKDEVKFKEEINWDKVRLLLKIGIVGAIISQSLTTTFSSGL